MLIGCLYLIRTRDPRVASGCKERTWADFRSACGSESGASYYADTRLSDRTATQCREHVVQGGNVHQPRCRQGDESGEKDQRAGEVAPARRGQRAKFHGLAESAHVIRLKSQFQREAAQAIYEIVRPKHEMTPLTTVSSCLTAAWPICTRPESAPSVKSAARGESVCLLHNVRNTLTGEGSDRGDNG